MCMVEPSRSIRTGELIACIFHNNIYHSHQRKGSTQGVYLSMDDLANVTLQKFSGMIKGKSRSSFTRKIGMMEVIGVGIYCKLIPN